MSRPLPALYCAGKIHVQRRRPELLDLRAKVGPTRVGLLEDGMALCGPCVHELYPDGVDDLTRTR